MSSRERIHHISCITNKSLFIVCGVGWEEKDLGITWSFTGKGGGGKQSSPTEYTGGNSRKLIANKPPMRGGGVINITEPYEGGRGKIGRFYDDRT